MQIFLSCHSIRQIRLGGDYSFLSLFSSWVMVSQIWTNKLSSWYYMILIYLMGPWFLCHLSWSKYWWLIDKILHSFFFLCFFLISSILICPGDTYFAFTQVLCYLILLIIPISAFWKKLIQEKLVWLLTKKVIQKSF